MRTRHGGEQAVTLHLTVASKGCREYETTSIDETLMGITTSATRCRPEGHPRRLYFPSGYGKLCWKHRTPTGIPHRVENQACPPHPSLSPFSLLIYVEIFRLKERRKIVRVFCGLCVFAASPRANCEQFVVFVFNIGVGCGRFGSLVPTASLQDRHRSIRFALGGVIRATHPRRVARIMTLQRRCARKSRELISKYRRPYQSARSTHDPRRKRRRCW